MPRFLNCATRYSSLSRCASSTTQDDLGSFLNSAGIGAGWSVSCGNIVIDGGIIKAYGGSQAAGIGGVIAERASLSGAEGGCQAEIGSASGMAAGAAVYLLGGSGEAMAHACAMALSGLLGLVCDPVAGLVEIPCVKRNVIGAMNAVTSADMAMAGIRSKIPPDEVIDALRTVGHAMSSDLRETGHGGLAMTPAGQAIRRKIETGD